MKRFISVILVFALMCITGIVSLSAYGSETDVSVTPSVNESITASRFQNMLNNNYSYGDDFSSVSQIQKNSVFSLLSFAKDETLKNTVIINFMKNMYGIDPSVLCDDGGEYLNADSVTVVPAVGYTKYTHTVTHITKNADGTFTVFSTATACEYGEDITREAISCFAPSANSSFGYILISCELVLPQENTSINL